MMLEHLGEVEAGAAVVHAIETVLADSNAPKTPDLGGRASTAVLGKAVAAIVGGAPVRK